jgi:hypothetical protein
LFRHAVTSKLTDFYHAPVIESVWNAFCTVVVRLQGRAAENVMKIYLLMLLIGTLLTAIHFTSAPKQRPETLPQ